MLFVQFVLVAVLICTAVVIVPSRIRRRRLDRNLLVHIGISAVSLLCLFLLTFFSEFHFKMLWFVATVQLVLTEFALSTGLLTGGISQEVGKDEEG